MASQAQDMTYGVRPGLFGIAVGVTNARYFSNLSFENSVLMKYVSGGSLTMYVFGASFLASGATIAGPTLSGAQLASLFAAGEYYPVGTSEILSIKGSPRFYIAADGVGSATLVIAMVRGMNQSP